MQNKVLDDVLSHINKYNEIVINIEPGIGKYSLTGNIIDNIVRENNDYTKVNLLILTDRYDIEQQMNDIITNIFHDRKIEYFSYRFMKYNNIKEYSIFNSYNYIVFDNANNMTEELYNSISKESINSKKILFYSKSTPWLDNKKNIEYKIVDLKITKDLEDMFKEIFQNLKFDEIKTDVEIKKDDLTRNVDFFLNKGKTFVLVNILTYKDRYISKNIIDKIYTEAILLKRMTIYETKDVKTCIIAMCEIDDNLKIDLYQKFGIIILDIRNIVYLCSLDKKLTDRLVKNVYFAINDVEEQEPIDDIFKLEQTFELVEDNRDETEKLIDELLKTRTGKEDKSYKKYEKICTKIIKHLFDSEFTQIKEQSGTDDELFVMDLICGIKGTTAFWKLLIQHYNTRFIVFEYKNYSHELSQNNIFITEKYLFNSALRNVAIVISRMGFSKNATKAAEGILKEEGKLLISLTDDDLVTMLKIKRQGEEPSDYLLEKLENILMSIGK